MSIFSPQTGHCPEWGGAFADICCKKLGMGTLNKVPAKIEELMARVRRDG